MGSISGGHFNPAVTVALYLSKVETNVAKVGSYIGAQLAGGILAGIVYSLVFSNSVPLGPGKSIPVSVSSNATAPPAPTEAPPTEAPPTEAPEAASSLIHLLRGFEPTQAAENVSDETFGMASVAGVEILYTFVLCFVVLRVAVKNPELKQDCETYLSC